MSFDISLKARDNFISLIGNANGDREFNCYRCGKYFIEKIDFKLDFLISNGNYNGSNPNIMYETIDSIINLEEIIISELGIIDNDYNSCGKCDNNDYLDIDI